MTLIVAIESDVLHSVRALQLRGCSIVVVKKKVTKQGMLYWELQGARVRQWETPSVFTPIVPPSGPPVAA